MILMSSVVQDWVNGLTWKQQTVLFCALRGCDTAEKNDPAKAIIRNLRGTVLHNAGTPSGEFMQYTDVDLVDFTKNNLDAYPIHFILHVAHAAEIIGYKHPDLRVKGYWKNVYVSVVHAFHMNIETEEQMDYRLRDGVDTCCHKT